jgi:hypothetical protein
MTTPLVLVSHTLTLSALLLPHSPSASTARGGRPALAQPAVQELCEWLGAHGGSASVVAGTGPYGLGLLATRPLQAGDVAVSVPASCLLPARPPEDAPALAKLQQKVPDEFWAAKLALALIAERSKGERSAFRAYLATLPSAFTVPLFWSPEAVQMLAGYPTAQRRLVKAAKFVDSFAREELAGSDVAAEAFGGVAVGADALGWAVAACTSRAYAVKGGARVLCPVIDVGNHAAKGQASCEVRGTLGGGLELVAVRDLEAGEEVTYCYGAKLSNDDFLMDYGAPIPCARSVSLRAPAGLLTHYLLPSAPPLP